MTQLVIMAAFLTISYHFLTILTMSGLAKSLKSFEQFGIPKCQPEWDISEQVDYILEHLVLILLIIFIVYLYFKVKKLYEARDECEMN